MAVSLPAHARVVIIGGGIVGCSVAYHLAKRGCSDVLLLERKKLTCGTTWHAAGLVGQLRATLGLTRLAQYTTQLYEGLERETGQATGFRQVGSIAVAASAGRLEELRRGASMARCFGLEVQLLTPGEARERWPLLSTEGVIGAVYLPKDGQTNPVDTTQALARGARRAGVRIVEDLKVTAIRTEAGRATGVATEAGEVRADVVVNCAGMWAREVGGWADVTVPLHAAEHFYIVTQPIPGLTSLPILRDADACSYFKEDTGKLLVGWFEPQAKPWGAGGIPDSFAFDQLPADLSHIEPLFAAAMHRVPALESAGVQVFFNGAESFTPDDRYLLGETPEVRGLYVAAGFNSIGIQSAGGAGKVLADWIIDGHPPADLWDVDIRRCAPFQRNRRYLRERTVESLGLLYAMHWPYRQAETARGVRRSALHDRLAALRRLLRRGRRLRARQLVRRSRRGAGLPVQLRPPELVRALGGRAPRGARTRRSVRSVLVREVRAQGARRDRGAVTAVRQRRRRAGRTGRVHAVAERARRDRGGPDGHARSGGCLPHRHLVRDADARFQLAVPPHRT